MESQERGADPGDRSLQPEQLLVVNRRPYPEMAVGSTRVRFVRMEELSAGVEAFLSADRVPPVVDLPGAPPLPGKTS